METYAYGFPRLGKQREFKHLVEGYWSKRLSERELIEGLSILAKKRNETYLGFVDAFATNEMTLYDHMLDIAVMFGVYKVRTLSEYYSLCRGRNALEMTKWFNTNYHYLVTDFGNGVPNFKLQDPVLKVESSVENSYAIAPFTFLKLSRNLPKEYFFGALSDLVVLLIEYTEKNHIKSLHLDDPALVLELESSEIKAVESAYCMFEDAQVKVNLFTYYDSVDKLEMLFELPVNGVGVDLVHDRGENFEKLMRLRSRKCLFASLVDGRNIWRTDLEAALGKIEKLRERFENIRISNAAPLFHLPISLDGVKLPDRLKNSIAFAEERLYELKLIKELGRGNNVEDALNWVAYLGFGDGESKGGVNLRETLTDRDFTRIPSYRERLKVQKKSLKLPLFPTTTIGSFPQTQDTRRIRLLRKNGKLDDESYETFIRGEIAKVIKIQEELNLDVLVHGEFERSDMVEFFAGKLDGIATTDNGWIISYGTRCYRPPIIYDYVERKEPMTIGEIAYAQSLTDKPLKGILTGPITIMAWSFVRNDIPEEEIAYQIALALKDEIKDYEEMGVQVIQIDEPAFREKAPIKRRSWDDYFKWAIKAFRLCHSSVRPETQIHTHMCYSEFGEIIEYILKLDFDVISIEASRSKGNIVEAFERVDFDRQIGLGVWDVHSPYIADSTGMEKIINRALRVIPRENFWVNPDCGLKTRQWEEVIPSLRNMTSLAEKRRNKEKH